jgi:putative membrane protein
MLQTIALAGWRVLWLVPYRLLYFLLYAVGWRSLLRPDDPTGRASFAFLFWITNVREAVDRLLPVASVGGSVVGVRLLRWSGIRAAPAASSIIVEVFVTVVALYAFTAIGLWLLFAQRDPGAQFHRLLFGFVLGLPVPVAFALVLRYGSVFKRLHRIAGPLLGKAAFAEGAAALDQSLHASLGRGYTLLYVGALQLLAIISGSFEIWYVLQLCQHPISFGNAVILESMTQAMRHMAFFVPAGIGVQEAVLVLFGQLLGISGELALAVSMAKRVREILCGLPALASWQWMEARRLTTTSGAER